jgi:outer membrane immunogenic protein
MRKLRLVLLGSAAAVSFGGSAFAGDPIYPNWQGGYIGANVGVARMDATCNPGDDYYSPGCSGFSYYGAGTTQASGTGIVGGLQAGYDWQAGSFVYGAVADFDGSSLTKTLSQNYEGTSTYNTTFTSSISWLASVRGRAGMDVSDTLVYLTGGLALAGAHANTHLNDYGTPYDYGTFNHTQVGWVAGVGLEHKFGPRWSVFAEALYYDLGGGSTSYPYEGYTYTSNYNFQVITARVGANFHF